jgi:hypothetical protein
VYTRPLLVTYKDLSSERIGALGLAVGNEANQEREHASYCVASERWQGAKWNEITLRFGFRAADL